METAKKGRLKMKKEERAKQFAPFAALKGYEEALAEKEKVFAKKITLSEEDRDELDRMIHTVKDGDMVSVVYMHGEECLKTEGLVSLVSFDSRYIKIVYNKIPFADIYELKIVKKQKDIP